MTLSIITINLNNIEGLSKTIDSVRSQSFTDYEWIVIDGGSTDGSKELIENKDISAVAVSGDERLIIMINEEDHLRIQAFSPGFQLPAVWDRISG